ncbi:MAG: 50S ribosomal protein L4 [Candidatus Omnitrophota bacterium]
MSKDNSRKIDILNTKGKKVAEYQLNPKVFDSKVNHALMHQACWTYLNNQRMGLASAKTKGEVRGGGKKPWRQKGTGRARVGSIRSPLWKGGGVTFGPKPHTFHKEFPQKMKVLSLKSALNVKLNDNEIIILENISLNEPKTREFFEILKNLKICKSKLRFVLLQLNNNLKLAARNLNKVKIGIAKTLTTYEALECKQIVFTQEALKELEEKLTKTVDKLKS